MRSQAQENTHPEIIPPIYVPLHIIVVAIRRKRLEPMGLRNASALVVRCLFVLLVVAVIGIDLLLSAAVSNLELASLRGFQICPARAWIR